MISDRLFNLTIYGKLKLNMFREQLAFVMDKSLRKVALCTRRAGKSHTAANYLILAAAAQHNCDVLYLGLTRSSCKNIMWPKFQELNRKLGGVMELVESSLLIRLPNGSRIHLIGADLENIADRLRGNAYALVIVDEAQSFGTHLQYLIDDVLEATTLDFSAPICLIGTPGNVPAGAFYNACHELSYWSVHKWSVLQNIYVPHAETWIENIKAQRGWDDRHPTYRREYLAEWCHDPDNLVYKNCAIYDALPQISFNYIIGLDYGYNDQTAFSVIAYSSKWPLAYCIECYGKSKMIPSVIALELKKLIKKYNPERIIADTGGLGKSITEEMRIRYELPIYPADKTEKYTFIEMMNGDFVNKKFFINKNNTLLLNQMDNLTWDDKHKENPTLPNDLCDATLYGYRFARHYWGQEDIIVDPKELLEQQILEYAQKERAIYA